MTFSCSIVVSSYNKAEYVGIAVESALTQTYPAVEVIVIDDGSRDRSADVLRAFGDRIRFESKPNGGQASAMNRGFALCAGDVVLFLDCDDVLFPDTVERVVSAWTPQTSKVHFKLQRIGASGAALGGTMPPYRELPAGDLSRLMRRFGFYPAPPTSGNAFARGFLEKVMPIPEDIYRAWPDTYLVGTAPLFGDIGALGGLGGSWRQTEGNYSLGGLDKVRAKLRCDDEYIRLARALAGRSSLGQGLLPRWPQHLKDRLIVAKFDAATRPGNRDLSFHIRNYVRTILLWPEYTLAVRLKFLLWAVVMLVMPASLLTKVPGVESGSRILDGNELEPRRGGRPTCPRPRLITLAQTMQAQILIQALPSPNYLVCNDDTFMHYSRLVLQ